MTKFVYSFGNGAAEGKGEMKELLGGKGANLAEMCLLGLPVPPGFTITTEVCAKYYENGQRMPAELTAQAEDALKKVEQTIGAKFGDAENPLLVSVRSGARASMPGMMDTVLNLGLNDKTVEGLANKTGNARFAYDSYRRFITMYSDVVLEVDHDKFEEILEEQKRGKRVSQDTDLDEGDMRLIVDKYKTIVEKSIGRPFPQDPKEQLWGAIDAVFKSWMNQRAITYRRLNNIPVSWGTAVNVQSMVFGNMGDDCATGVTFTRNPSTGENALYGEYLVNAQGEDVVAGIRTPQYLTRKSREEAGESAPSMEETMPEVFKEFVKICGKLEAHYKDMQDIEFTVQNNKLWMLQTRSGKRTAAAAIKIAVDMVGDGIIDRSTAIMRIDPAALDQLLHPALDPKAEKKVIANGLPASPGAAAGIVVFTAEDAESRAHKGDKVILVRIETSPEDIHGMHAAQGILTARGGMTSHAAVVARGMGKPCVSGAGEVHIDYIKRQFVTRGVTVKEGDFITLNGSSGEVMLGKVPMIQPQLSGDFATIMKWADEARTLKVRANAETPLDTTTARKFGAEGIGLCRTEHMFFEADRITAVREMILATSADGRKAALAKILPMQKKDFMEIFKIMDGLPVTVRLLDPPLHEFLPHNEEEMKEVAKAAGVSVDAVKHRAHSLHEMNPMLGHRGCRLAISHAEIYEMQAQAVFEAVAEIFKRTGEKIVPELMIPLIATVGELQVLKGLIDETAKAVEAATGVKLEYQVGTMIELPRAALRAGDIAKYAEFFSFGTNDLTQTTMGLSRDDSANFIDSYVKKGIFERDPFASIDVEGVGELVKIAIERGRAENPNIKLGVCGEHGGEPVSIRFFHNVGLNYVSCSPYRVPIARLAAAQAAIAAAGEKVVKLKAGGKK